MSEVINGVTHEQFKEAQDTLSRFSSAYHIVCQYLNVRNINDVVDIYNRYKMCEHYGKSNRADQAYSVNDIIKFFEQSNNNSEISTFIEAFNQFIDANFPGEKHAENLKDVSNFIADLAAKVSSSEAIACQSASLFANADQVARNLATLNEHNKQLQDQVAYLYEENEALKKQLANK
jgi:hypothetical protein